MRKKKITGYQVRNKEGDGIRFSSPFLSDCKRVCEYGGPSVIWSTYQKPFGVKLRFFWMSPYRKVRYDRHSNVVNFFNLHIGWELMMIDVPYEIVWKEE